MRRSMLFIVVLCSPWTGGCGTFSDALCGPVNDHAYYRGVRFDLGAATEGCETVAQALSGPPKESALSGATGPGIQALEGGSLVAFMAADLPFSALVDTLLLPYLAYRQMTEPPRKQRKDNAPEQGQGNRRPGYPGSSVEAGKNHSSASLPPRP